MTVRAAHAWLPWILFLAAVAAIVAVHPTRHTVTPVYGGAAATWWEGQRALYDPSDVHGFLYLPACALVHTPFHALPSPTGPILWRIVGWLLLAAGVRRLVAAEGGRRTDGAFALAGVLVVPAAFDALRNGQANVHLLALVVHAALDAAERRWGRAAAALSLALALKPIVLAPLLLFGVLYRPLSWRLGVGTALVLAVPFLHPRPGYVAEQYGLFVEQMGTASAPGVPYTNLLGGLQQVGVLPHGAPWAVVAGLAALLALGLALAGVRRLGPSRGARFVLGLSLVYLLLFNPRTEANSYVFLGALVAADGGCALVDPARRREGLGLLLLALLLGTHLVRPGLHALTRRWLKPLLALLYGVRLLPRSFAGRGETPGA